MTSKYTNPDSEGSFGFKRMFPTPSAGSGRVRPNSANTGKGQGKESSKLMVSCKICGYVFDANRVDTQGEDYEGDGGLSEVTVTDNSTTLDSGATLSAQYGDRTVPKGSGCPHCGSKNTTK